MLVYGQNRGEKPKAIRPVKDMESAEAFLDSICEAWHAVKPGRKSAKDGCDRFLYFSDGKLAAMLWVNPILTPPQEPDMQPRRKGGKP